MPSLHGVVQCLPGCAAWWSPSNRTDCTCARIAMRRCTSAVAVIGVRSTVRAAAPRCAGTTRAYAPARAIRQASVVHTSMPPDSVDGERDGASKEGADLLEALKALGMQFHDHSPMIPKTTPSGSSPLGMTSPLQAHVPLDKAARSNPAVRLVGFSEPGSFQWIDNIMKRHSR